MKRRKNKLNERLSLIPWGFWTDFPAFYASLVRGDSTENEEEQSNVLVMLMKCADALQALVSTECI